MLFIHRHLVNQSLHVHLIVNRVFAANELHKSERVLSPDHQIGRAFVAVFEHNHAVADDWIFAHVHGMPVLSAIVAKRIFFRKRVRVERGRFNGWPAVLRGILSAVVAGVVFAVLQCIERIHELQIMCVCCVVCAGVRACVCVSVMC